MIHHHSNTQLLCVRFHVYTEGKARFRTFILLTLMEHCIALVCKQDCLIFLHFAWSIMEFVHSANCRNFMYKWHMSLAEWSSVPIVSSPLVSGFVTMLLSRVQKGLPWPILISIRGIYLEKQEKDYVCLVMYFVCVFFEFIGSFFVCMHSWLFFYMHGMTRTVPKEFN
jgi:hypothetical protein